MALKKFGKGAITPILMDMYDFGYRDGMDAEFQQDIRGKKLPKNHKHKSFNAALAEIVEKYFKEDNHG